MAKTRALSETGSAGGTRGRGGGRLYAPARCKASTGRARRPRCQSGTRWKRRPALLCRLPACVHVARRRREDVKATTFACGRPRASQRTPQLLLKLGEGDAAARFQELGECSLKAQLLEHVAPEVVVPGPPTRSAGSPRGAPSVVSSTSPPRKRGSRLQPCGHVTCRSAQPAPVRVSAAGPHARSQSARARRRRSR